MGRATRSPTWKRRAQVRVRRALVHEVAAALEPQRAARGQHSDSRARAAAAKVPCVAAVVGATADTTNYGSAVVRVAAGQRGRLDDWRAQHRAIGLGHDRRVRLTGGE